MSQYYEDDSKITFDEARQIVRRYISQNTSRLNQTHSKAVASAMDIEKSHHNLIRINEALGQELAVDEHFGSKTTRYKL